ncbi:S-DNA-T family DNA segregation ATPase FtsK/SpoIIIE [Arthrobacter pascens]|uniref:FtsK/SpoIIIE domain-containing protein n=1 Tax=Arthrobacter pascens TaxID=1677 RepID=UPI00278E807F|nr:FtsK/SpoIIIE domain-containing protein [Arthrobacter pascens]MDQ0677770.1 S-DNA-T family DNA segregation ATPase FtsK/SpoIIIE [Arthrobacter pascens]
MQLHCTLVSSPGSGLHGPPVELTIDARRGTTGAELQDKLADRFGTGLLTVEGQAIGPMKLGEQPLVHGAVLVDGPAQGTALRPRRTIVESPASLALSVLGGAGAGTVVPLRRGTYTIGRSTADILIPDAELSREHARIVVTDTAVTIVDLDSANGTEVNGERVRSAIISTGSSIRCGNSTMSIIFLEPPGAGLDEAGTSVQEPLVVSRRVETGSRAALLLAATLPLVIGVGLAAFTGMWMFLAFTAVSAFSIVVPVFSGHRQRRALAAAVAAAVREDKERRRRSAPPLTDLAITGQLSSKRSNAPVPSDGIWLRLGQALQAANIRFEPADPDRAIPSAGLMPLTLDPARRVTTVRGPRASIDGLVRSILMQLRGYPRGCGTFVVVHGAAEHLPLAARNLAGVTLAVSRAALGAVLDRGYGPRYSHGVVILAGGEDAHGTDSGIIPRAVQENWRVIRLWQVEGTPTAADVELGEQGSLLRTPTECIRFVPDLVQDEVFSRFCRRLARPAALPTDGEKTVPSSCSLADLLPLSAAETTSRWAAQRLTRGLAVPVGRSVDGKRVLDLQADGPHLLVAGTTGSGKSELLRTLTVALALSYPPDRINFLFVDFKGGSGLGPLTGLPHCVGMLTDLTNHELERSLSSLRAEIRLREELLASVQAPDLPSYRASQAGQESPLPHLVVVIDEFRMLVEDAPEALRELMRIAAIGRSLGVHLIMATQRPQGALTADIRANVTTSIALRVQSEMESMDIISTKAAAGISVDTPGRAYLARGTEAPQEFQAASLGGPATEAGTEAEAEGIKIRFAIEALESPADDGIPASDPAGVTPALAAAPLVTAMTELWAAMGGEPVRRPVAAPLPCILPEPVIAEPALTAPARAGAFPSASPTTWTISPWTIQLGLMDLPDEQRIAPVAWEPAGHGHLGLVGASESGAREALRFAVRALAAHPTESHLYILDGDGSFIGMAGHNRVGARAGLHELRRAVRILERLAREQSQRLSRPALDDETPLILVIAGWGSWVSAFRSGPLAWAEDLVHDLVRDGSRAKLTVLLSGQRDLVTARFFASVPNRVYFPTGSSEDSRLAWPKMPATARAPGRAVAVGALSSDKTAVCQFYTPSRGGTEVRSAGGIQRHPIVRRPFRVDPLPAKVPAHEILARAAGDAAAEASESSEAAEARESAQAAGAGFLGQSSGAVRLRHHFLRVGVGGDDLASVSLRLPAGGVLAVLGGPSSGKTNLLQLLPLLNGETNPWLTPEAGADPTDYWSRILRKAVAGEVDRGSIALVDDADLLPAVANHGLTELSAMGFTVVVTASFSPMVLQRVPLVLSARGLGTGLLIAPRTLMDGDLFGVRFDVESNPPPGRSVLISGGRSMAVQLGWVTAELPAAPLGTRDSGRAGHQGATSESRR